MEVNCKHCGRYLFKRQGTIVIEGLICPNSKCKAKMNFKYIQGDTVQDIRYKFAEAETLPKNKQAEVS